MSPHQRSGRTASDDSIERIKARLFDADQRDRRLTWEELLGVEPTDRQLLWVDITGALDADAANRFAAHFKLQPRTRLTLTRPVAEPWIALQRDYLHVRVAADPSDEDPGDTKWLDVITGPNLVITRHDREIPFLDHVDDRIEADTAAGMLSSTAFFTAVIDAAITSYHAAVDEIEDDVDRLDALSLRGRARDELLEELVRSRRRIARLRRLLADHRGIFTAMASPDVLGAVAEDDTSLLQGLATRYDGAMGAVEDSREALLGSFDVYMSRTAQRTNDVMKTLTIVTVLLLPGSLLAGLLGMNVVVPLNADDPTSFWIVIGGLAVLGVMILLVARLRRWI